MFLVAGEMAFADGLPKKFLQSQGSFSVDIIRTKVAEGDVYVPYKIVSSNEGKIIFRLAWPCHRAQFQKFYLMALSSRRQFRVHKLI